MELSTCRPAGAFALVHQRMTGPSAPHPGGVVLGDGAAYPLGAARDLLYVPGLGQAVRREVWQHAVGLAQRESDWRLVPVWFALPRLRSTVWRTSLAFRLDRADAESEAVLALLEQLGSVEPDQPDVDDLLVRAAVRRVWALARRGAAERSVADVALIAALRHRNGAAVADGPDAAAPDVDERDWELSIDPPAHPDGLAAQLRFTVSRESVEGVRLGALAGRLGLQDVLYRARRPLRGRRIGTLSLRPAGAAR
ncbi:hypothetical protein ABT093_22645 [Kitasatospora sp. NPDC002551]|uniref:hypothetical protein n=1 Tax=unclassified Kitasatospora TaxID=2633591 RepID=UPI00332EC6A8